ncbi:hypothetical protein ACLBWX_03510 [Methylobacterium sp. M6A4_1b]
MLFLAIDTVLIQAVPMLDIDPFERIIDAGGQAPGDAARVRFAALLRKATDGRSRTRPRAACEPVLARLRGEAFVRLIPGGFERERERPPAPARRSDGPSRPIAASTTVAG